VNSAAQRNLLAFGVFVNMAVLAYFKYFNFFVDNLLGGSELGYNDVNIILPLAISFFTFQQITFLVGVYRGEFEESNILRYALFVSFFPQLIAGPIVHYREMLPQYLKRSCFDIRAKHIAVGSTIFIVGLFKKVVVADGVALYANPVFEAANIGTPITFFEAWGGALAYTLQLYFDFSGYSDMAVGLAYSFGLRLALNFYSPYRSSSIIEFWRRWHITLSRFLRDYLYIPLGGNRKGSFNRYRNLLITMFLGGLWHGAGWTFVAWGLLHGFYLIVNYSWRYVRKSFAPGPGNSSTRLAAWALTFLAVVTSWVLFRSDSFDAALTIYRGMLGENGILLPPPYLEYLNRFMPLGDFMAALGIRFEGTLPLFGGVPQMAILGFLTLLTCHAPNLFDLMGDDSPALDTTAVIREKGGQPPIVWKPTVPMALLVFLLFLIVTFKLDGTHEFLYFQF
jgi:D-alanyl-lipoteichoic acid acyltransferase DltB (MBOAT superfamily)